MSTPQREFGTARPPKKELLPRKRILPDNARRLQVWVPAPLADKAFERATKGGVPSMSEYVRRALEAYHKTDSDGVQDRLDATLKRQATSMRRLEQSMRLLYAAFSVLIRCVMPRDRAAQVHEEIAAEYKGRASERFDRATEEP